MLSQEELNTLFSEKYTTVPSHGGYDPLPGLIEATLTQMFKKPVNRLSYTQIMHKRNNLWGLSLDETEDIGLRPINSVSLDLDDDFVAKVKEIDKKIRQISTSETLKSIISYFKDNQIPYINVNINEKSVLLWEECGLIASRHDLIFIYNGDDIPDFIEDKIVYKNVEKKISFKYVICGQYGFETQRMPIKKRESNLEENYNDTLPHDQITQFLTSDESGIVILHGEPGTGKSTYIRHLITEVKKDFIYLDISCMNNLTDATFIQLLCENKNSIIIIEDSEKLLTKRENNRTNIANLLNLTDGILADGLNLKFICTFNAKLNEIDDALLRKGRLKIKYKFEKLSAEKTAKLFEKLDIKCDKIQPMTLAEIYNYLEKVDYDTQAVGKLGFGL